MHCVNHPDITAEERCHYCKQPVCAECSKEDRGLLVCPQCYKSLNSPADACDEPSNLVTAHLAVILSVAGLVFLFFSYFLISTIGPLFFLISFGLFLVAITFAREVKPRISTQNRPKETKLANVALRISIPLIALMSLFMLGFGVIWYITGL